MAALEAKRTVDPPVGSNSALLRNLNFSDEDISCAYINPKVVAKQAVKVSYAMNNYDKLASKSRDPAYQLRKARVE